MKGSSYNILEKYQRGLSDDQSTDDESHQMLAASMNVNYLPYGYDTSQLNGMGNNHENSRNNDRRVWAPEEDEAIRTLVHRFGTKSWSLIAEHIHKDFGIIGRSGKQCRERWHNHLDPSINKDLWTEEEERVMTEAHKELGNKWSEIAKRLPGRTDNHVKNHWYSFMRRNVRRLNREIGHVNVAAVALTAVKSVPIHNGIQNDSSLGRPLHKLTLPNDNDYQYNERYNGDSGDDMQNNAAASKRARGSGRKAQSLSELKRYFKAAEEAASEVLAEEMGTQGGDQVMDMTRVGTMPLRSPDRLSALQSASFNPLFREKLKRKLEDCGGASSICLEDLQMQGSGLINAQMSEDRGPSRGRKGNIAKKIYRYGSSDIMHEISQAKNADNSNGKKSSNDHVFAGTGQSHDQNSNNSVISSNNSDENDETLLMTKAHSKHTRHKKRDVNSSKAHVIEEIQPSIKQEQNAHKKRSYGLTIKVADDPKSKNVVSLDTLSGTPVRTSDRIRSRANTQPPLSLISNFSAGAESPNIPMSKISSTFPGDFFSALVDTPSVQQDYQRFNMKPSTGSYDFDEVTKHFSNNSPRLNEGVQPSPNRWGAVVGPGSLGLGGTGAFNFSLASNGFAIGSSSMKGSTLMNGEAQASLDHSAEDALNKKFKKMKRDPTPISTDSDISMTVDALISINSPESTSAFFAMPSATPLDSPRTRSKTMHISIPTSAESKEAQYQ